MIRYTIQPTAQNRARITKEMNTRALRYKKQSTTRALIIDTIQRAAIILAATALLVTVYLINN